MDKEIRKKVLRKIPYGLYILGLRKGDDCHGMVGSWLSQCSFEPPLLMLGIRHSSHSRAMLKEGAYFTVNFPGKDQKKLVERFFKPYEVKEGKFGEVPFHPGTMGAPVLDEAIAYLECRVSQIVSGGDHDVLIAQIVESEIKQDTDNLTMKDTGWHYGG